MQGFEKFSTVEQKRKFTNAGPSGLHPARRENLRCLGSTEEQFVQGLKSREDSENLGASRKTDESGLDRPSSSEKEGDRAKTSEEHWQELMQIWTPLLEVSKELYLTAKIITKYEKQPPQILAETLKMDREVNECLKNLEKVVVTHEVSDGDFQGFFKSRKELIENKKQLLVRVGKNNEEIKNKLDWFEGKAGLCYELFEEVKVSCELKDIETFKNNKLKKTLENIYKNMKLRIEYLNLKYDVVTRVVDQGKVSGLSKIRQSDEYSILKGLRLKLEQVSIQIKGIDKDKSVDKDRLLKDLADINRVIVENYDKVREKFQDQEIIAGYVQKGKEIFEFAKDKSAERQKKGMTRPVVEKSWESFYDCSIDKLKPNSLKRNTFDELMEAGWIEGKESDYYVIVMEPKLPDNSRPFDRPLQPLIAYVNPKDGVLINLRANRDVERQWRKENFPQGLSQQWIKGIKKDLGIEEIPRDFFESLQASDLSAFACRLAQEKYKEEHGGNDLSLSPLTKVVGSYIFCPETTILLYEYMKAEKSMIFKPGDKGFDLVSATHFGRRVPFMQADYSDIIGDGMVDHYEICTHAFDEISIKIAIKKNANS